MKEIIKKTTKKLINSIGYEISKKNSNDIIDLSLLSGNDCLVAGPYLGEFGWELMQWQGYIRQLSKFYKKTIIYGRVESRYFYEDFATDFKVVDCKSWDTDFYMLHNFNYAEWSKQFSDVDLLVADNRCLNLPNFFNQTFIPFGKYDYKNKFDIVIHARQIPPLKRNNLKNLRNWPNENWDILCKSIPEYRIAAVGIPELSYAPPGIEDLRGLNTHELCSVLASSNVCIGPSSGLMHLATLCKTPQLVWTSKDYTCGSGGSAYRYIRSWNPFATPVKVITDMGFNPSPEFVRKELKKFLLSISNIKR